MRFFLRKRQADEKPDGGDPRLRSRKRGGVAATPKMINQQLQDIPL